MQGIRQRRTAEEQLFRRQRRRTSVLTRLAAVVAIVLVPVGAWAVFSAQPAAADTPPTVTSVSPDVGPITGGSLVTIDGTGFVAGSTSVDFGTVPATSVTVTSSTELTAISPSGGPGSVDVIVSTPSPEGPSVPSVSDLFAYGSPSVSGLTPNAGPLSGDTVVTVTGTGFAPGAAVKFGLLAASTVVVTSGTTLLATTPASGASGALDITVTMPMPGGTSATSVNDQFVYGPPTVSLVTPDTGPANTATHVTITGTAFLPGDTVTFGPLSATNVTVVSETTITALAPSTLSGGANVQVTNPAGSSTPSVAAQFAAGPPSVTAVTPAAGLAAGGETVTVSGDGFVAGTSVSFGSTASQGVTVETPTSLQAIVPPGTDGSVDVTATTPNGTSEASPADLYAYGAPIVTAVSPDTGAIGGQTTVTVKGMAFVPNAVVSFGSMPATSVTVNATGTILQVTAPANAAGSYDVTVTTPAGTSATSFFDLYAYGAPVVTGVSPDAGPLSQGNDVFISGNGFVPGVTVFFGAVVAPSAIVYPGGKIIEAVAPANTAGPVDITVTSAQGTSATSLSDAYFYGSPAVTSISPTTGSTAGGTAVTITGSGFAPDATVTFGMLPATAVTRISSTSITAISPAANVGVVPIVVTTPAGASAQTNADLFEYSDQLQISCAPPPSSVDTCATIDLPAVSLQGQWQSETTSTNAMYITDDRGDASVGWSLSAYVVPTADNPNSLCAGFSGFCNATIGSGAIPTDAEFPADFLSVANVSCGPAPGNSSPTPLDGTGGALPNGPGAISLCTAQAGSSAGTFVVNADFTLQIPPYIYAGNYEATVEFLVM